MPLVFAHVVITNMLGVLRAREIHAQINKKMDLWERGLSMGLLETLRQSMLAGRSGPPVE